MLIGPRRDLPNGGPDSTSSLETRWTRQLLGNSISSGFVPFCPELPDFRLGTCVKNVRCIFLLARTARCEEKNRRPNRSSERFHLPLGRRIDVAARDLTRREDELLKLEILSLTIFKLICSRVIVQFYTAMRHFQRKFRQIWHMSFRMTKI